MNDFESGFHFRRAVFEGIKGEKRNVSSQRKTNKMKWGKDKQSFAQEPHKKRTKP